MMEAYEKISKSYHIFCFINRADADVSRRCYIALVYQDAMPLDSSVCLLGADVLYSLHLCMFANSYSYMQLIQYKEYKIKATAFLDDQGKWVGQATITPLKGEVIVIQNPMVFDNETFGTKAEAEDFALDGAQFMIDSQPDIAPQ